MVKLVARRIGMDEVHFKCVECDFSWAVALNMNGQYDGDGKQTATGHNHKHSKALAAILKQPVPGWIPPTKERTK